MVNSLRKGDKIVTNGGIFGTITKVGDDRITLEVTNKVNIQVERQQVARMDKKVADDKDLKEEKATDYLDEVDKDKKDKKS